MQERWLRMMLFVAAVVTGGLLAVHPNTGWLLRTQLSQILRPAEKVRFWAGVGLYGGEKEGHVLEGIYRAYLQEVARSHPDDYHAQLASALSHSEEKTSLLLRLLPRFPNRPQLHAHILRFLTQRFRLDRPEEYRMSMGARLFPDGLASGRGPFPPTGAPPMGLIAPLAMGFPMNPTYERLYSLEEPTLYDLWLKLFLPPLSYPVMGGHYAFQPYPDARRQLETFMEVAKLGEQLDADNAYFPAMLAVGYLAERRDEEALDALLRASRKARWQDYISDEPESVIHLHTLAFGRQPAHHRMLFHFSVALPHLANLRSAARVASYLAYCADLEGNAGRAAEIRLALVRLGRLMRQQDETITTLVGIGIAAIGCQTVPMLHFSDVPAGVLGEAKDLTEGSIRQMTDLLRRVGREKEVLWVEEELRAGVLTRQIIREGEERERLTLGTLMRDFSVSWLTNLLLLALAAGVLLLWFVFGLVACTPLRREPASYLILLLIALLLGVWAYHCEGVWYAVESIRALGAVVDLDGGSPPSPTLALFKEFLETLRQWLHIGAGNGLSLGTLHLLFSLGLIFLLLVLVALAALLQLLHGHRRDVALVEGMRRSGLSLASVLFLLYVLSLCNTARMEKRMSERIDWMTRGEVQYYARFLGKHLPDGRSLRQSGNSGSWEQSQ